MNGYGSVTRTNRYKAPSLASANTLTNLPEVKELAPNCYIELASTLLPYTYEHGTPHPSYTLYDPLHTTFDL